MSERLGSLKLFLAIALGLLGSFALRTSYKVSGRSPKSLPIQQAARLEALIGPRVDLDSKWVGRSKVSRSVEILVLAGHADSQGIEGSGTPGEAVGVKGAKPMDPEISDELFWNILVCKEVVKLGEKIGLNISFYDPGLRTIVKENDPRTNWSVGHLHAKNGGYVFEIHFDSYGNHGHGSGLIPAVSKNLNYLDESLARNFGRFPLFFRGGLGAPRRDIRILEVGKLEGELESSLRDPVSRDKTIRIIAKQIVSSLDAGLTN